MLLIYYCVKMVFVIIQDKDKAPREKILLKKTKVYDYLWCISFGVCVVG